MPDRAVAALLLVLFVQVVPVIKQLRRARSVFSKRGLVIG
jgi:hypothetical protein